MTKIKLADGTIINADSVELVDNVLCISTKELTVEELAALFSNPVNTEYITLMTESEVETGYKYGFIKFIGIDYDADGLKTIQLMQADNIESRLAVAENNAKLAINKSTEIEAAVDALLGTEEE